MDPTRLSWADGNLGTHTVSRRFDVADGLEVAVVVGDHPYV